MRPSREAALLALLGLGLLPAIGARGEGAPGQEAAPSEREGLEFFEKRIRPILAESCYKCHSAKAEKVKGGLLLDTPEGILKGGTSGSAIVRGDPEKSLLVKAIRNGDEDLRMPPKKPLLAGQVGDFEQWIRLGAPLPGSGTPSSPRPPGEKFWSFRPLGTVTAPDIQLRAWPGNDIDRFIVAKLEGIGLRPAADADRRTLIRRATFDLIGLPPTPAEVDAFVVDPAPDAFPKLVDRLLALPQYGERWGRHWLDVVRYADTSGFENDLLYPNAWRYRDYVIRSFNADKPFDRFIQEQVAGDELWPKDGDAVLATGMYCVGPAAQESAMAPNQLEYEWLTDAVDTTGTAFLGLSLGCARCHDHKYDPIKQKDYFALQAIFAPSDRPFPDKIRVDRIKGLNGLLSCRPLPKELLNDPRCTLETEDKVGLRLFHRREPMIVRRLHRGELGKPREAAAPAFPVALVPEGRAADSAFDALPSSNRRAALARWLTSSDNPMTARVLVNRVWGWHFGQAIVRTPNDFGRQGEPPTHPELLDWLARDLVDHGCSLKHLHRRIMLSRTYRMESRAGVEGLKVDPQNRLLWHFPRHRLEGEVIRDSMLACAGTLNPKPGGPPVVPPLTSQELTGLFQPQGKWTVTKDKSEHARRSVYVLSRRTFPYPFFAAFDPPEIMTSCPQRARTAVPAQALTLFNSPLAREQALAFAGRLIKEGLEDEGRIVSRAWWLSLGREPEKGELDRARAFLRQRTSDSAVPLEATLADLCLALFNTNEFIYID